MLFRSVRFSFHFEIGESPRCCPVLRGLRDRCFAAKLATRKAEVSGHAPQAAVAAPSGFQPAAARSSALTSRKWLPRMDSRHQPPGSEPGALAVELQGNTIRQPELHRSLADTSGVRRYQRFGGVLKWSGTSVLPRVSRRSERRGLLSSSCPDTLCLSKWWSHGESHPDLRNAIASSCYWTMAPKWSARPDSHRVRAGLQAAASTISASRAFGNGEADGCCPRSAIFTGSNAGCYITASV